MADGPEQMHVPSDFGGLGADFAIKFDSPPPAAVVEKIEHVIYTFGQALLAALLYYQLRSSTRPPFDPLWELARLEDVLTKKLTDTEEEITWLTQ